MKEKIMEKIQNIDYSSILKFFKPIVFVYSKSINEKTLKLIKNGQIDSIYIPQTPIQEQKYFSIDFNDILAKEFGLCILDFANFIIDNFDEKNLINFYNNINNLQVIKLNEKEQHKFLDIGVGASYNTYRNTIKIGEHDYSSIYHELFHMASAFFKDGTYYSGFRQPNLGVGINEGYTQLLTERYFGKEIGTRRSYQYEVSIAKQLEKIVEKEKMESLYLNSNLRGLILELSNYSSEESIIEFILDVDLLLTANKGSKIKKSIIEEKLKSVNEFLCNAYFSKLKQKLDNKELDIIEVNSLIILFINSFKKEVKINDYTYISNIEKRFDECSLLGGVIK